MKTKTRTPRELLDAIKRGDALIAARLKRILDSRAVLLKALKEIASDPIAYDGLEECDNGAACVMIAQEALKKVKE